MNTNKNTDTQQVQGARRVTPWQQLWEFLSEENRLIVSTIFSRLKKRDQEDLCYAMIAYYRYGLERSFKNQFLQAIYLFLIDLAEGNIKLKTHTPTQKDDAKH